MVWYKNGIIMLVFKLIILCALYLRTIQDPVLLLVTQATVPPASAKEIHPTATVTDCVISLETAVLIFTNFVHQEI